MKFIKSPLNYVGGKHRLLPQIMPFIQQAQFTTFHDVFAGGLNVGINQQTKVIANDLDKNVIELLSWFKDTPQEKLLSDLKGLVSKYQLSKTNKEGFLKLREDFNNGRFECRALSLYGLILYCYNHQIRFNQQGKFNSPFGKERGGLSDSIIEKIIAFNQAMQGDITLTNQSFEQYLDRNFTQEDFVYIDPPYLISEATYNNKGSTGGWTEKEEICLLEKLDKLNEKGVKFALSNVIKHKGKENTLLKDWAQKYQLHLLNYNYKNASYNTKHKNEPTQEVLIINY